MSLDDFTDAPLAALLMLAQGAANADLAATAGEDVVSVAIGAPLALQNIGQNNLPALLIYRDTTAGYEQSQFVLNGASGFVIEYWAPVCPDYKMVTRWPLLRAVWTSITKALQGGMHPSVSSGAQVLRQAGLRAELGSTTTAAYRWGQSDGGRYPYFRAGMRFYEEFSTDVGVTDVDGLDDWLTAQTTIELPGNTATTPDVAQTITLDGYSTP